ncbi:hypothetical protein GCM10010308_75320 [Streptomyces vinaceusdrappus]|nr:hypothetical protein GCM10010301_71350 [Streptomyces plicatus]GHC45026.1 hypothetical protein GCM10010308_75320 [Streptomyces vinaceusdrappus]
MRPKSSHRSPNGLSDQAIGARLHLTEGPVKYHLACIYAKLGTDSRTAAVATVTAIDLGLIRAEQYVVGGVSVIHDFSGIRSCGAGWAWCPLL